MDMDWDTVARRKPGNPRGAGSNKQLCNAYRAVFLSTAAPTEADKQLVLADLAKCSGYYSIVGPKAEPDERAFADGKRAVFNRILAFLQMPREMFNALSETARLEESIDRQMQADPDADLE